MRREVRTVYFERKFTVLQVTHDFHEAGLLGDVGVVLDRGRVLQVGKPEDLFRRPASPIVADFLGAENVFAGMAQPIRDAAPDWAPGADAEDVEHAVAFTTGSVTLYAIGHVIPGSAHAVIHADDVSLSRVAGSSSVRNQFRGRVVELAPAGAITRVTLDVERAAAGRGRDDAFGAGASTRSRGRGLRRVQGDGGASLLTGESAHQ